MLLIPCIAPVVAISIPIYAIPVQANCRAWGFQDVEATRFPETRHMKVVRSGLWNGRLHPKELLLVLIYVKGWVDPRDTVPAEGLCQWKIPVTSSAIEPPTFPLAAQCLNKLRHRMAHQQMHTDRQWKSHNTLVLSYVCFTETCRRTTVCERLPVSVMCVSWYKWMTTAPCTVTAFAENINILGKQDSTGS